MLKKINVRIEGIHCKSCKTLIETEVDVLPGVKDIEVDHRTGKCQIEFDDEKISKKNIFETIENLNYQVKETEGADKKNPSKKTAGVILALALFAFGYYLITRFGLFEILAKLNDQNASYGLIFLIGLLASFHCVGMCGGLVVTYTARHHAASQGKKTSHYVPHLQYNVGRMISYSFVGGILGGLGSFFGISPTFTGTVTLIAGGFMVLMGLSLLTRVKWLEKIKPKMPEFIARFLYGQRHTRKPKGPLVIGLLNGFMPCGPLQAMQLYALASGSVGRGALSMGIYALGTVPLMFGFGSVISAISQEKIKQMMRLSGVIVIILGIFMLNRGLINFGHGFRGLASQKSVSQTQGSDLGDVAEYQVARMDLTYSGYSPNVLFIKKDVPVRWIVNVKQMSGCTDEIVMSDYNIRKKLAYGENVIEFTPKKTGDVKFSCWMQMVWGKFVVTEGEVAPSQQKSDLENYDLPVGTCSGSGACGGSCGQPTCGCQR